MIPAPVPRQSLGSKPSLATTRSPRNKVIESAPAESQLPRRTTRGKTAASATRTKTAPRATKAKAPPVTPKRRRALDPVSLNAPAQTPQNATVVAVAQGRMEFDDFSKFIGLIRGCSF